MAFIGVDDMMGECLLGRAQGSHVQDSLMMTTNFTLAAFLVMNREGSIT